MGLLRWLCLHARMNEAGTSCWVKYTLKVSTKEESLLCLQDIFKTHFPKETTPVWLSILPSSSSSATCHPVSTTSERAVEVSKTLTWWLPEQMK